MKYSDFKEKLNALLPNIVMLVSDVDKNLEDNLIVYILVGNPLAREQFLELITSLPPFPSKESIMDTLEQFIDLGRKEGIAKTLEEAEKKTENSIKNFVQISGLTDEQIAYAMTVPVSYVAEIRKNSNR